MACVSACCARGRYLGRRFGGCVSSCCPPWGAAERRRLDVLWTDRWRSLVWSIGRRVCPRARDRFLHARTHPPECWGLCLGLCLSRRVAWFVLPAWLVYPRVLLRTWLACFKRACRARANFIVPTSCERHQQYFANAAALGERMSSGRFCQRPTDRPEQDPMAARPHSSYSGPRGSWLRPR